MTQQNNKICRYLVFTMALTVLALIEQLKNCSLIYKLLPTADHHA
jgi:hypothetical protein